MSVAAVTWALSQWLDPAPKMVLVAIADCVNHKSGEDASFPSLDDLAEIACQHRRTVQRHILTLESLGLLIKQHRRAEGGRQTSNLYRINMNMVVRREPGDSDDEPAPQVDNLPPLAGGQIATLGGGDVATLGDGNGATPTINRKKEPEESSPKAPKGAREVRSIDDDEEGFNRFFDDVWLKADPRHEASPKRPAFFAWRQLTPDERARASKPEVVAGYLLSQRRAGWTKVAGAARYLRDKAFERVKTATEGADASAPVPLGLYDRAWWCRFYERAKGGGRTPAAGSARFMAQQAECGQGVAVPLAEARALEAASASYVYVLVASPEFIAWREWFAERGFRLPRPTRVDRIWMPSARPPETATSEAAQ